MLCIVCTVCVVCIVGIVLFTSPKFYKGYVWTKPCVLCVFFVTDERTAQ